MTYFYITEHTLDRALDLATQHVTMSHNDIRIIKHCCKSLLFHDGKLWIKKLNHLFDVTMGSFDGAQMCELVGALILSQLSRIINKIDMGLYRYDGLIIIRKLNGPKLDNYRKKISNSLKLLRFKSTIHTNLKTVNFLDITLNLTNCTYEPYKKDNNTPIYIHTSSNHPPSNTKQIPKSISRRLSSNSSNIDIFNKHKHLCNDPLKHSGYKLELKFTPQKVNSKHRSRNIIWFNPPIINVYLPI